jgi:thiol-disulfide isomerase/thioredoxin
MFNRMILLGALLLFVVNSSLAQGIDFFHGSWPEALEKAKAEEKLIFVDAFAVWCGPCKRMAREVFPDEEVGAMFNANFICMKIDMEKSENAEFASKYPVSAYPTLFFIDGDGKVTLKEVGAKQVKTLLDMGRRAMGSMDNLEELTQQYDAGERDPAFLYKYVRALNRAGQPSLKVTNHYLMTQKDLSSKFNLEFLFEGVVEADSRVFDLFIENKKGITALVGEEKVEAKIRSACMATVKKGIKFRSLDLIEEAKTKMNSGLPDEADAFGYHAELEYYATADDRDNYIQTAKNFQKKSIKKDPDGLNALVKEMLRRYPVDEEILDLGAKWAEMAANASDNAHHYLTLTEVLTRQEKTKEALKAARKGLDAAKDGPEDVRSVLESLIRNLEEKERRQK